MYLELKHFILFSVLGVDPVNLRECCKNPNSESGNSSDISDQIVMRLKPRSVIRTSIILNWDILV